jgi:hypothetical protein
MFLPLPNKYVSEREDYSQPAKASEAWAWLWEQRIMLRKKPTQREIAKHLCWSRHKVRELQNDFSTFCGLYFTKKCTKNRPLGDEFMGAIDETPTNLPPKPEHKVNQKSPQTDHLVLETPAQPSDPEASKRKEKENNLINLLLIPIGVGVNKSHLTKNVIDLFNHWYKYNTGARSFRKDQVKVIRSALRSYTITDIKLVITYVHDGDNWWTKNNTKLTSILRDKNLPSILEEAELWKPKQEQQPKTKTTGRIDFSI